MEAVIGALYLDGGLESTRRFILPCWSPLVEAELRPPQDSKRLCRNGCKREKSLFRRMKLLDRDGPAHAPEFTVKVSVEGYGSTTGRGKSKRIAEQDAAGKMIAKMNG